MQSKQSNENEQLKEKEQIGKALRIILVRSFTYLSLLVIIVFVTYFLRRKPFQDTVPRGSKYMVAIVDGYSAYKAHIQGVREGLLFKGIHTVSYGASNLTDIKEDPVYVIGTERVKEALEKLPGHTIIGYARFREKPRPDYTGVFNGADWAEDLKLYKSILPGLKNIGVLYTESLPESTRQVEALQKFAQGQQNLAINAIPLSENGKDLKEKLESLLDKVDAFLGIIQDKNIEAALPVISASCLQRKIPFIGGGKIGAQMGALAALEYDQKRLGRQVADNILYQIIVHKKDPAKIPILLPQPDIFINLSTSYRLGIRFPEDIQSKAMEKYS
ncbi:MAG: ABC transporter substrate binding protein [bacterium]